MKLYVYEHCPFCIRPRMMLGLKNIECEIIILQNDDEALPTRLIGKKMLPILVTDNNQAIAESLDIISYLDDKYGQPCLTLPDNPAIEAWMETTASSIYQLAVPRWAQADFDEFSKKHAREYFIHKKEAVFGDFAQLMAQSGDLIADINAKLAALAPLIALPSADTVQYSITDIRLLPLLGSLSIVKGLHWPPLVNAWCKEMAIRSKINLNDNIAI